MKKVLSIILACVCSLVFMVASASAFTVELAWDANTELDLEGYRVYVSTTSKSYNLDDYYEVGLDAYQSFTIPVELEDGVVHYFVVTAYSSSGEESGFSNEICSDGVNNGGMRPDAPTGCFVKSVN